MRKILPVFFILFFACGSDVMLWPSVPVGVNDNSEQAQDVFAAYEKAMGFKVFEFDEEGIPIFYVDLSAKKISAETTHCGGDDVNQIAIFIDEKVPKNSNGYRKILAHELGHAIGHCWHLKQGLMRSPSIDVGTLDELVADPEFVKWVRDNYEHLSTKEEQDGGVQQ